MHKNLDNALEKTDWKKVEKWSSYVRFRENICEKLTFSEKYFRHCHFSNVWRLILRF